MQGRYSPNYQIPYRPTYEAARLELEADFGTLEEMFRRRKEMEMHENARLAPLLAKEYELAYYNKLRLAEEEERQVASIRQESAYRHHLLSESQHLQRIEQLRKERDNLERQKEYKRTPERTSPFKPPSQPMQENADDDELIKKYEDGSKAKQYYMDLKIQSNRKEQQDHYSKQIQLIQRQKREKEERQQKNKREKQGLQVNSHHKSHAAFTDRKPSYSNHKKQQIYDTPYDIIAATANKETFKRSPLVQQLQKEFNKLEEEKSSATKFAQTMKVKDSSPLRILEESIKVYKGRPGDKQKDISPSRGMNKYQSMGKFAPYRSKSALSPMKKSQDGSYLQSRKLHLQSTTDPKPTMKEIELSALKKIQNRLRVSKVMYEDSQFRNVKYQENHLFNTFEIESRQRREIKGKVNSHPYVLKKHALVC